MQKEYLMAAEVLKWFEDLSPEPTRIYGDFPEYTKIATKKIYDGGRFVNQADIDEERKVCVIGERTQKELFDEDEQARWAIYSC